jgi:GMP synthase-like glutamine amidotransferase
MNPRVLVIQNEESAPAAMVGEWLEEAGLDIDVIHAYAGQAIPAQLPEQYAGLLAFGGAMGANDDDEHAWLTQERHLLATAAKQDVPTFGVCLGAQVLATAVGGTSTRADVIEIGAYDIDVLPAAESDPVLGMYAGQTVKAAQWHQDWIATLPNSAVVLASNSNCPVQAFRVGENVYGVQFHPEVDAASFKEWYNVADEAADRSGIDMTVAVEQVREAESEMVATWRPVFHNWAALVKRQQG